MRIITNRLTSHIQRMFSAWLLAKPALDWESDLEVNETFEIGAVCVVVAPSGAFFVRCPQRLFKKIHNDSILTSCPYFHNIIWFVLIEIAVAIWEILVDFNPIELINVLFWGWRGIFNSKQV